LVKFDRFEIAPAVESGPVSAPISFENCA
jgi:hypothetical protein